MRFVAVANTAQHPGLPAFARGVVEALPAAALLVCGDLLKVFPEPGEDSRGSIFEAVYGSRCEGELERLRQDGFRDVAHSTLVPPLRALFARDGAHYRAGELLAADRYDEILPPLAAAAGPMPVLVVPGNMDYPRALAAAAARCPPLCVVDTDVLQVGGLRVGGVGGIPHAHQPFCGVTVISPNEVSDGAFAQALDAVWGVDVLLTHLSPTESPVLADFVRRSPVRLVVCRAPYELTEPGCCRGAARCEWLDGKPVLLARPFDAPAHAALVAEVDADPAVPTRLGTLTCAAADAVPTVTWGRPTAAAARRPRPRGLDADGQIR